MQPPAPPAELAAPLPSPLPEQPLDSPAAPAVSPSGLGLQPGPERTRRRLRNGLAVTMNPLQDLVT
ncbi:Rho GTPase-activating protein 44 [Saguinus oedipus]|uniref:Rho GTPase-activating protein 44 n=1 Tax=Saguinus oedipus TaxID=9490 RepID=A0ABQ9VNZ6_SAGOE|nr:Rho GTPase-activating protein 44 [Saguinus oedipus]